MLWEKNVDIHEIKEIRAKTTVYFGVGAIHKIKDIAKAMKERGIDKVLVVTGKKAYRSSGAWAPVEIALNHEGIKFIQYDRVTPNPTVTQADQAAEVGRAFGAKAIIAIGGGSPIDIGKSVAILLEYPKRTAQELYEQKIAVTKALPVVAINLTHGTGTEANRFAVATITEKEYKPAIAFDCSYPWYSIDDPALTLELPAHQSLSVTLDALNHVVEAATAVTTNGLSIVLARETIRLIGKYLPVMIENPKDLTARYHLMFAAMIAGMSFDNGLLHLTHALEHPLSGVKPDVTHGIGLCALLPAVVKQIYPVRPEVLADIFAPIVPGLKGTADEAPKVVEGLKTWLESVGFTSTLTTLGFTANDVPKLVALANDTPSLGLLLSVAPLKATTEVVTQIYRDSL